MPSDRARLVETLESRRLMAIESAIAPVSLTTDPDLMLQSAAGSASIVAGTSVIAYADRNSGSGKGEDVYLRRFDAAGVASGAAVQVNTTTANAQMNVDVATNAAKQSVVVWQSEDQDGDGWGVYARVYDANGNPTTGEVLVNGTTATDQITPRVGIDSAGRFVVAWTQIDGSGNGTIYARRFNANGTAAATEFRVSPLATGSYVTPDVAVAWPGNFAVTWAKINTAGDSNLDVQAQAYDVTGVASGSTATINTSLGGDQAEPAIASLGGAPGHDGFVVAFSSLPSGGNEASIYTRLLAKNGTVSAAPAQVNQDSIGSRSRPRLTADISGDYTVGWTQQGDGEAFSSGVYRSYDANNKATSNEMPVSDGQNARTLFDLMQTGVGRFADVSTMGEFVGYGVGTMTAYANVIRIVGDTRGGVDIKNDIAVSELNSDTTVRVKQDGTQSDYVRSAYAYLHAELGDESDFFNAGTVGGNGGVHTLPISIHGGDGSDSIYGGGAGDSLYGDAGTDQIWGGASKDYIVGGDDNDLLHGEDGNDNLVGGAGKNTFFGDAGDDRLSGSGGHDSMNGGDGSDRIYGGAGNDTMDGGGGTDRLYAGDGNDSLIGGSSNDRLYGEAGNDTLTGGKGTDYLFGGLGTDTRKGAETSDVLDSIEVTA